MPFRERLKSIVKGEAPVFEHLRQWRAAAPQHIDSRRTDVEPSRDPNLFQQNNNIARDERATEAAVVDSGPAYTTQESAMKHEDTVRRQDKISSAIAERREGRILKDSLEDRETSEDFKRHEEAPVEIKGHSDSGGGGYDVDRRTKAPPPPPPTTAPAVPQRSIVDASERYALFLRDATREGYGPKHTTDFQDEPRVSNGPQRETLTVTRDGVIQDQQAIRESMAIDDTSVEEPGSIFTSRQGVDRPAPSRRLSDEGLYRSSVATTEPLGRVQTAAEQGMRDVRSRSYQDDYMSKGAMCSVPPPPSPENNLVHGRSKDDIYVTEGPSGYHTSTRTMGTGGDRQWREDMQGNTALPTAAGAAGRDRVLSDTPIDKDVRWGMREYIAPPIEGHNTPGTAELKRASSTPPRYISLTAESPEKKYRKVEEQESRNGLATSAAHYAIKDREYTRLSATTSTAQYSILHNILPPRTKPTLKKDPSTAPSISAVAIPNRRYMRLRTLEGEEGPVMGVEEEGEWYKDDPARAGCYCKGGSGGVARVKEERNVERYGLVTAGKGGR
ncbi:hypothetical protein BGX38DRAFT_1264323 [Terfezia claveryi]|nr:hypothetical protein BGX38DRAFT_1264323 [Terfezia claveryi]